MTRRRTSPSGKSPAKTEDEFLSTLLPGLPRGKNLLLGPGDDCAVIQIPGNRELLLLKTDCLVENVHFLRTQDPVRVGWKALCRAISDIAAMGGEPSQALVTVLTPPEIPMAYWKKIYQGLSKAARRFGIGIAGGETSRIKGPIAISISLTGSIAPSQLVRRSGGRPGELLYVTGRLGGSIRSKHLSFVPRLAEARWLVVHFPPTAMMDLSDGLGSDLPRLARASKCGVSIDPSLIPRTRGCSIVESLSDGEDYELLFACAPALAEDMEMAWKKKFPRLMLTHIGRLTRRDKSLPSLAAGFDHFSDCQ